MKLNIKNKKENVLLKRTELEGELVFTGATPSKATIKNDIASQTKSSADLVEIKKIKTEFGHQIGTVIAYVYKDIETKNEMITPHKKHIEKEKKAKEAAEKPKEKAEAPKEEPKKEEKATKKEKPKKEEAKAEETKVSDKPKEEAKEKKE